MGRRAAVPFRVVDGAIRPALEPVVRGILRQLVGEVLLLLGPAETSAADPLAALLSTDPVERPQDPALLRLLPDAYAGDVDDGEAAREFRRLTDSDLRATKRSDAGRVLATLEDPSLDVETAQSWLRAINDLRLVLGARLDLSADGQAERMHEEISAAAAPTEEQESALALLQVYDHLAMLVELLVESLDLLDPPLPVE